MDALTDALGALERQITARAQDLDVELSGLIQTGHLLMVHRRARVWRPLDIQDFRRIPVREATRGLFAFLPCGHKGREWHKPKTYTDCELSQTLLLADASEKFQYCEGVYWDGATLRPWCWLDYDGMLVAPLPPGGSPNKRHIHLRCWVGHFPKGVFLGHVIPRELLSLHIERAGLGVPLLPQYDECYGAIGGLTPLASATI